MEAGHATLMFLLMENMWPLQRMAEEQLPFIRSMQMAVWRKHWQLCITPEVVCILIKRSHMLIP